MRKIQNPYLVVDAGNTNIKICEVCGDEYSAIEIFESINEAVFRVKDKDIIMTSVLDSKTEVKFREISASTFVITHDIKLPFSSIYESMNTVGIDRLCNVAGILKFAKNQNALCIDVGTCIKFDFISSDAVYEGGSIAPGIQLRYKSLNDYTSNLPLINDTKPTSLIAHNTINSIISGVLNGMNAEILGMIHHYNEKFGSINIYLTGGDVRYFDIPQKNNIFAVENLTILGAVEIFKLNAL